MGERRGFSKQHAWLTTAWCLRRAGKRGTPKSVLLSASCGAPFLQPSFYHLRRYACDHAQRPNQCSIVHQNCISQISCTSAWTRGKERFDEPQALSPLFFRCSRKREAN